MEYIKINSLWKRNGWYFDQDKKNSPDYQKGRQSFIIGDYAEPEFGNIKNWSVDEKVDGTNIRITFNSHLPIELGGLKFEGRTADAQIPCQLLNYLQMHFTHERLSKVFDFPGYIILFGEGYGPKIQKGGGNYRNSPGFILFDVVIAQWWLQRPDVKDIAHKLEIPMVPQLGIMNEFEIVELVKSKPQSICSTTPQIMEGVVCRSEPLMMFRKGTPIMWKLKCKEF